MKKIVAGFVLLNLLSIQFGFANEPNLHQVPAQNAAKEAYNDGINVGARLALEATREASGKYTLDFSKNYQEFFNNAPKSYSFGEGSDQQTFGAFPEDIVRYLNELTGEKDQFKLTSEKTFEGAKGKILAELEKNHHVMVLVSPHDSPISKYVPTRVSDRLDFTALIPNFVWYMIVAYSAETNEYLVVDADQGIFFRSENDLKNLMNWKVDEKYAVDLPSAVKSLSLLSIANEFTALKGLSTVLTKVNALPRNILITATYTADPESNAEAQSQDSAEVQSQDKDEKKQDFRVKLEEACQRIARETVKTAKHVEGNVNRYLISHDILNRRNDLVKETVEAYKKIVDSPEVRQSIKDLEEAAKNAGKAIENAWKKLF